MNADIRTALADAEHAIEHGNVAAARSAYVDAGDYAVSYQLWRSAARSYRRALELDLVDRFAVEKLVALGRRLPSLPDWIAYGAALDLHVEWPHFSCRHAQVLIDDRGAYIDCPTVGRVMQVAMTAADHLEITVDQRFEGMPIAMALTILHRAMWPSPRDPMTEPMRLSVRFGGSRVTLDERGEWDGDRGSR